MPFCFIEEVANPMYESAGDFPTTSNNNLYAVVDKSKKPFPEDKNLYAVVDKSKNNKKKGMYIFKSKT